MNNKLNSKSFRIFGNSNNINSNNIVYNDEYDFLYDKYVFLFDRMQVLEDIEKIVKNKFVYNNSDDIFFDKNVSKDISLTIRDIDNNLGPLINNILYINRDITCILHIMITYKWCVENSVGKFVLDLTYNDTNSKFIAGYDSIVNKSNNFKTVVPLTLSKNDTIALSITNYNSQLLFENITIIFEEI